MIIVCKKVELEAFVKTINKIELALEGKIVSKIEDFQKDHKTPFLYSIWDKDGESMTVNINPEFLTDTWSIYGKFFDAIIPIIALMKTAFEGLHDSIKAHVAKWS